MDRDSNASRHIKRLFTIREASAYLGRSVYSIRELIWGRQLPVVRTGRKFWIDLVDLERFIAGNKGLL